MLEHRLNSCVLFATGKCSYQMQMERAYLIPQLMSTLQLKLFQQTCMDCNLFKQIQRRRGREAHEGGAREEEMREQEACLG